MMNDLNNDKTKNLFGATFSNFEETPPNLKRLGKEIKSENPHL